MGTQIISKKLNPKLLEADDVQDLKLQYYEYMVRYWLHEKKFLDASKAYQSIFNTKVVQEDETKWKPALIAHAAFLILAPYDNERGHAEQAGSARAQEIGQGASHAGSHQNLPQE